MGNFLLFLISIILFTIIWPIGFIWSLIDWIFHPSKIGDKAGRLFRAVALSIDMLGNVSCRWLFDDLLITKDWYKFGIPAETISSVLGKNNQNKTLKPLGKGLHDLLNAIQPNHCEISINNNI